MAGKPDKTSGKTSGRAMVPQPHGGALLPGAGGGPQPGAGRPPSAIRNRLRGALDQRVPVLEEIADGVVTIKLAQKCEHCGKEPTEGAPTVEEVLRQAANPADRLKAIDMMAKYGFGSGMPSDEVRARLRATVALIEELPEAVAEPLIEKVRKVWPGF
jgi:hypothetical protein